MKKFFIFLICILSLVFLIGHQENAQAYIGPGAGFAFVSSFFILFLTLFLAIITILLWPFRLLLKALKKNKRSHENHHVQRVIIVGLDGMDPTITAQYMEKGKLPHLAKLSKNGTFKRLHTTLPAMSPVAWSSFITGVDPSRHNIFDFLNRDLRTYMPLLSSTKIDESSKKFSIGKFSIPIGKPKIKLLRKGRPFWNILGEYGVFSSIIRVPMTFPPEKMNGVLLSGMCVPDLKGTQGTFTFYSSDKNSQGKPTGGEYIEVIEKEKKIVTYISGPENTVKKNGENLRIPLEIAIRTMDEVELKVSKDRYILKRGVYSDWIPLIFKLALNKQIRGICRFYVKQIEPYFEMYMTPINIDPAKPALPISSPVSYSIYLSKMLGSYATLGLAEDTWALNEQVINEDIFLEQVYKHHKEREEMFFNSIDKVRKGLCVCVFDAPDRIQHMFMRFLSDDHPASNGEDGAKHRQVLEILYKNMDSLIGKVMERMDEKSILMVISDHGFSSFKRGVNLNTWLYKNGYLALKKGKETGDEWFQDVDWSKTKAYTFGLSGIYINEKGRESKGIVDPQEKEVLKKELGEKLQGLMDEERGETSIRRVFDTKKYFDGPYREAGPDLFIGYNFGYRTSWGAAVGKVEKAIFEDNKKNWSGDHCIDPELVPGIFFCNKKISFDAPHILDIAPTVLQLFGAHIPSYMQGKSLIPLEEERI